ncbi:NYN domain-containing protein [Allofustis seminis]|uniref:NYN domain-containing protein n=1 Tax=Allofustis seminis TaxID=166939 RepID=UPI000380EDB5|nr:NYN domain-containing protein [Allofustis seminis]
MRKNILYVDGYNMIGAWPQLIQLKNREKLADARDLLLEMLSEYAKYRQIDVRVVFDAQFVPGAAHSDTQGVLTVIYTREGETADSYIERVVGKENLYTTRVEVATSDLAEQWLIFQRGATRKSAQDLYLEVMQTKEEIRDEMVQYHLRNRRRTSPIKAHDHVKLRHFYVDLVTNARKKEN